MARVKVVTDSACDLSEELTDEHNITVVPLTIRFGHEELLDRRDLTPEDFWRRCKAAEKLPETAAPAPGAFRSAFDGAVARGADGILCLTISGRLSATYQSACAAAEQIASQVPVKVVDTESVTMGQGLLALVAAQAAREGAALDELESTTRKTIQRTHVYGVVDTLDHLQKGGRIGGAAALLGSLLSIKPVIQVKEGVVEPESRQRTRTRSLEYLASKVKADAPLDRLAVASGAAEDIGVLVAMLDEVEVAHPLLTVELGPVVGTHTGPGAIGVCYQTAGNGAADPGHLPR